MIYNNDDDGAQFSGTSKAFQDGDVGWIKVVDPVSCLENFWNWTPGTSQSLQTTNKLQIDQEKETGDTMQTEHLLQSKLFYSSREMFRCETLIANSV